LYDYSKEDPLRYNLGLKYYLSGGNNPLEDFIQLEIKDIIEKLDKIKIDKKNNIWNAAIFACIIGISDLPLNLSDPTNLLSCSPITLDDIRFLGNEGLLLKAYGRDSYRIRHEKFAYEFLSLLYKQRFGNLREKFNQEYNVGEIIKCIWNNLSADRIIDLLNACSYLQKIESYSAVSRLVVSDYVVPAERYRLPSGFTKDEQGRLYSYGFGNFYYSMKDFTNSLAYYERSLELNSKDATALANKGSVLFHLKRNQEALTIFNKALDIDSKNMNALIGKGVVISYLSKNEDALTWFDKALEIDARDINALRNRGIALYRLDRNEDAITWFDKVLEIDAKDIDALFYRGAAYQPFYLNSINESKFIFELGRSLSV
jgi:tetratricopeptide (TPR) repeat protein